MSDLYIPGMSEGRSKAPGTSDNLILGADVNTGNSMIWMKSDIGSDHSSSGIGIDDRPAGESLAIPDLVYYKSDGKWWKADADAIATMPALGLALESQSADSDIKVLIYGVIRDDSWDWTVGGLIYASATAGGLTQTAPQSSEDQVTQVVGIALHADYMLFNPALNTVIKAA